MSMFLNGSSARLRFFSYIVILIFVLISKTQLFAYSPEDPEVQAIVKRAGDYLSNYDKDPNGMGHQALIALALVKSDHPPNHPKIIRAVEHIRVTLKQFKERRPPANCMYQSCVALLFLAELDAEEYQPEIKMIADFLLEWQKSFGGWGYLEGQHKETGDTSMTQYGVLATWLADRTGAAKANVNSVINVGNWLMRTQDPSGGWGYQGIDPENFELVEQEGVQNSLSAAGVGSIYMVADLLRLTKGSQNPIQRGRRIDAPAGLRAVVKQAPSISKAVGPLTNDFDTKLMNQCMSRGDNWMTKNFQIFPRDWQFYYLYALERYESFKELAEGRLGAYDADGPGWYNQGVQLLQAKQREDGHWSEDFDPTIDTCFAILFLTRGTQKTIMKAEGFGGRLKGGRGLPSNTDDVTIGADGSITKTAFQGKAETLLGLLESSALEDLDATGQDLKITLSSDPQTRNAELIRLRRLVAAEDYKIRVAALKGLAASRELDNVPTFIFALSDPDQRVVIVARNALRSISRKFNGFGLSDTPSEGEKIEAVTKWKKWYLSIRPRAQFLN